MNTCSPTAAEAPAVERVSRPRAVVLLVIALLLGLLAPVALAGNASAATRVPARSSVENHIAWAVLGLLNLERAAHHLPAVHMNNNLRLSSRRHNITMARYNTMSHQLSGEPDFTHRIDAAGYHWTNAGENIAFNSDMTKRGAFILQTMMYNEHAPNDGHRVNILSRNFRDIGVDIYFDRAHHKMWLTTDFGHR